MYFAHQHAKQEDTNATQHETSTTKLEGVLFYFLFFSPSNLLCKLQFIYVGMHPGSGWFE